MTKADATIAALDAAEAWWEGKRPLDWGPWEHESNPAVNCVTLPETVLAGAVVEYIQVRRRQRKKVAP